MKIGVLTFYRVANFGANLQALSTYHYLRNNGHEPWFIRFSDEKVYNRLMDLSKNDNQAKKHIDFIDEYIASQSRVCHNAEDVANEIMRLGIDSVIVGSDAVLQHHHIRSRIHKGRRKPFYIIKTPSDQTFPNPFWGMGIENNIPMVMMSVSSQNSEYKYYSFALKQKMAKALERFRLITVRDNWSKALVTSILGKETAIKTPDPVFGFNYNVGNLIPSKEHVLNIFGLPKKYILVSLFSQVVSKELLNKLREIFHSKGIECVALPMPTGINFKHEFRYTIDIPLSPLNWYALIKYSCGYIGSNMHPIVVSLHNAVPCYSIDNWGTMNFWNKPKNDGASKVLDIMNDFGVSNNHIFIAQNKANITAENIVSCIEKFPVNHVKRVSNEKLEEYRSMMTTILDILKI